MSILQIVETTPSRVRVVARYLAASPAQRAAREHLRAVLSPESTPVQISGARTDDDSDPDEDVGTERSADRKTGGARMIDKVLTGCSRMGLVLEEGDDLLLNPALREDVRQPTAIDSSLPTVILDLICDTSREANHDLARLIAWYLLQDPLRPPCNERAVIGELQRYPMLAAEYGLKNQSYGQFEDWVVYLGFAWAGFGGQIRRGLTPDPTAVLRRLVGMLAGSASSPVLPAVEVLRWLAERCAILDGGWIQRDLAERGGITLEEGRLSLASSQAWLRLAEEGYWRLLPRSDASNPVLLTDANDVRQVGAIELTRKSAAAHRGSDV